MRGVRRARSEAKSSTLLLVIQDGGIMLLAFADLTFTNNIVCSDVGPLSR